VNNHERTTIAQGQRRRNLRLALVIATLALGAYCAWWLKAVL
jgi:hypothetical protein